MLIAVYIASFFNSFISVLAWERPPPFRSSQGMHDADFSSRLIANKRKMRAATPPTPSGSAHLAGKMQPMVEEKQ